MVLDYVSIFKKNGVILYDKSLAAVKGTFVGGSIINHLIRTVLLEEKAGAAQANLDRHVLKWTMANEVDVAFVLVYNKTIFSNLTYVDEFLARLKEDFLAAYTREVIQKRVKRVDYDARFCTLLAAVEARARAKRVKASGVIGGARPVVIQGKANAAEEVEEDRRRRRSSTAEGGADEEQDSSSSPEDDDSVGDTDEDNPETEETFTEDDEERIAARARLAARRGGGGGNRHHRGNRRATAKGNIANTAISSSSVESLDKVEGGGGRGPKKPTQWHDGKGKMTKSALEALDRSKPMDKRGSVDSLDNSVILQETRATYLPQDGERPEWEIEETVQVMDDDDDEGYGSGSSASESSGVGGGKSSFFSKFFSQITGNAVLEATDLDPILEEMKNMLIAKNVATEIAENICESVRSSLVGQKLPSLTRVKTVVKEALERAIVRVLTPKRSTDVLREIMLAKSKGRPYSIVFVGINGVGKSTSLSKVCYYLKTHGLKVMIAACDTFRSGAVEQLKVHARCLEVDLFDKGYHKDPAAVAKEAIKDATAGGYDVVLVDTAGRMQNKEPLMRALAKLVSDNEPDLVLFVGEALVGNDGIDQLTMFNQALANYSPPGKQHQIDGIILTKFDTVDEKVGAALSMSYKTGQPIMFVGTGQKYTHLKKLNVNMIINCLFR